MSQLVERAERRDECVPLEGGTQIVGGWRPKSNPKSVILSQASTRPEGTG